MTQNKNIVKLLDGQRVLEQNMRQVLGNHPTEDRKLEVIVSSDIAGNCDPDDRDTARLRHRYLIYHAECPILWTSQLQPE